ncbi:MAG: signal peptidase I [Promethearchaeota archaeon]
MAKAWTNWWKRRSDNEKTITALVLVVVITLGSYGGFMVAMRTTSPLVVVTSESMVPTLEPGDLLVLQGRSQEQIQVGDIIVYQDSWYTDAPIVHRIVDIDIIDGVYHYITRGDANTHNDPGDRTIDEVIGVVVFRIPFLGHVSMFLRTPAGIAVIVIIFAAIIILPELVGKFELEKNQTTTNVPADSDEEIKD